VTVLLDENSIYTTSSTVSTTMDSESSRVWLFTVERSLEVLLSGYSGWLALACTTKSLYRSGYDLVSERYIQIDSNMNVRENLEKCRYQW
jgi:hypothetical protein